MIRSMFMCFRVCAAAAMKGLLSEKEKWIFEMGVSCKRFSCGMCGDGQRLTALVAFLSHLFLKVLIPNAS